MALGMAMSGSWSRLKYLTAIRWIILTFGISLNVRAGRLTLVIPDVDIHQILDICCRHSCPHMMNCINFVNLELLTSLWHQLKIHSKSVNTKDCWYTIFWSWTPSNTLNITHRTRIKILILNTKSNCHNYTDEQFISSIRSEKQILIIHFNCRSLDANFHNIKHNLNQFKKPFNTITIPETWINSERDTDFQLKWYDMSCINRENMNGVGVALQGGE